MYTVEDGQDYIEIVNIGYDLDTVLPGHEFEIDQSANVSVSLTGAFCCLQQNLAMFSK